MPLQQALRHLQGAFAAFFGGGTAPAPVVRTRPGTSALSVTGPLNRAAAVTAVSSVVTVMLPANGTP